MPQDPPNLDKIIKVMGLTGSNQDGEALSALRKATAMLKEWGWTWETILRGKIKIMPDPFANIPMPSTQSTSRHAPAAKPQAKIYDDRDEIEKYFEKCGLKMNLPLSVNQRLASIERSWNANGYLVYGDYDFLRQQANSRRRY